MFQIQLLFSANTSFRFAADLNIKALDETTVNPPTIDEVSMLDERKLYFLLGYRN
jgi:hypothetical protein